MVDKRHEAVVPITQLGRAGLLSAKINIFRINIVYYFLSLFFCLCFFAFVNCDIRSRRLVIENLELLNLVNEEMLLNR